VHEGFGGDGFAVAGGAVEYDAALGMDVSY
jgi:hypothetical protein